MVEFGAPDEEGIPDEGEGVHVDDAEFERDDTEIEKRYRKPKVNRVFPDGESVAPNLLFYLFLRLLLYYSSRCQKRRYEQRRHCRCIHRYCRQKPWNCRFHCYLLRQQFIPVIRHWCHPYCSIQTHSDRTYTSNNNSLRQPPFQRLFFKIKISQILFPLFSPRTSSNSMAYLLLVVSHYRLLPELAQLP